tara:strand:- start:1402 stop:1743 length:342 start_codon:yes stop_codon:yes gene_type:complete
MRVGVRWIHPSSTTEVGEADEDDGDDGDEDDEDDDDEEDDDEDDVSRGVAVSSSLENDDACGTERRRLGDDRLGGERLLGDVDARLQAQSTRRRVSRRARRRRGRGRSLESAV